MAGLSDQGPGAHIFTKARVLSEVGANCQVAASSSQQPRAVSRSNHVP